MNHICHPSKLNPLPPWLIFARNPSRVVDMDGPTPVAEIEATEVIDPADIYGLEYDESNHPIPYQPWRRGETLGCEDPIEAPWRQQAEGIIVLSAANVGVTVTDVTWFLTSVIVSLDLASDMSSVPPYQGGPEIAFATPGPVVYANPDNPNPEDITVMETDEEYLWERDDVETTRTTTSASDVNEPDKGRITQMEDDDEYAMEMEIDRSLEKLPLDRETREDMAGLTDEQLGELERAPEEKDSIQNYMVDSLKISTIAKAILDGLEQVEEDLQILSRHEVILTTSPDISNSILETQRQFDAYRGFDVIVETQDPWDSNRILRGSLLERNSMDVIINKKGRMVTIPLNFVKVVRLSSTDSDTQGDYEEDENDDEF
jgi:ribosome maturation factor RimP